jgi:hypothetical protein
VVVEFFSRALRMSEINAARYAAVFCDCESEKIVSLNRRGEGGFCAPSGGHGKISVTLTVIVAVAAILTDLTALRPYS